MLHRSRRRVLLPLMMLLLHLSACSETGGELQSRDADLSQASAVPLEVAAQAEDMEMKASFAPPALPDRSATRMIIRTAQLRLIVADPVETSTFLTEIAVSAGGYTTESNQWNQNGRTYARLTLRVPASQLDSTLGAIRRTAVRVENEQITGQDVSEEYSDLSAQLINLEAAEGELRELLSTVRQRTQKAADILEVYTELTRIRGDIERTKGRLQYLSQMTAYSTIHVELIPDVVAQPLLSQSWRPLATVKEAGMALLESLKKVGDFLIWFVVYLLPLVALLIIPLVLVFRSVRNKYRQHKSLV